MNKIQTIKKVAKRGRRVEFRLNDEEYDIGLKNEQPVVCPLVSMAVSVLLTRLQNCT